MTTNNEIKKLNIPGEAKVILDAFSKITLGKIEIQTPENFNFKFEGKDFGPFVKLKVKDWNIFSDILNKSDIGLAECYLDEKFECDSISDLIEFSILNEEAFKSAFIGNLHKILFYRLKHEARENSITGSKKNIHDHYDLGNEFYSLWLDKTMSYSSAFFKNSNETMEEAQSNKYQSMIDLIGARPGDHILEIGCGWGGFIEHAGKLGIKVTGVTISLEQFKFAKERIQKNNLQDICDVKICDYRLIEGQYDFAVSIEMIEAVGEKYWDSYFETFKRVLRPNGKFSIQAIVMNDKNFNSYKKGTDFIQQYIFPGGMLLSPDTLKNLAKKHNYKFEQSISFGLDYAATLNYWFKRFNSEKEKILTLNFDERFIRLWNFYLEYCEGAFKSKRIDVVQISCQI